MLLIEEAPALEPGERQWLLGAVREVMTTDGAITPAEQAVLQQIAAHIGAKDLPADVAACELRGSARGFALVTLYVMAWADGSRGPAEEAKIRALTSGWQLDGSAYREAEARARRQLLQGVLLVRLGAAAAADEHVKRAAKRLGMGGAELAAVAAELVERLVGRAAAHATRPGAA